MKKLIEIQNELKVPKGNINKFGNYKYRSAEQILEAAKPILKKHGALLTLSDSIELIGGKLFLVATASIADGTGTIQIKGFAELSEHKGMSAEQCTGTASSYARKYALNGLFLIDETEADSDSSSVHEPRTEQKNEQVKPVFNKDLFEKAKTAKATIDKIKKAYTVAPEVETAYNTYCNGK